MEMRDIARPIVGPVGSCIRLGAAARNYELRGAHYSMLPSFYGLANEDPMSFIRDFYGTVEQFPLQGLNEDQLHMRCFPYTLKEKEKTWLMSLPADSLTTWGQVVDKFMSKYYSHQKTTGLRQKLATFQQNEGEPFHEAWERFKQLQADCPHHHFPVELLNQFFYDGLSLSVQCIVDGAAGGTIGNMTAAEVIELYEMLGANSQQKSVRGMRRTAVNEVESRDVPSTQM